MQPKPLFPSLPRNVSTLVLRQQIRQRIEIADRLGLIRKPRNVKVSKTNLCPSSNWSKLEIGQQVWKKPVIR